ncbi:MAG: hypothetical protein Q7W44_10715 [Coriobacteriia bacterium]|nr:hypothetical protein [Coriobacteriia bacterium]
MGSATMRRRIRVAVVACLTALVLVPVAHAAAWPYTVHQVTDDDLNQEQVFASGRHLFWAEARPTFHDDGTVTHSPYVGRYLDRVTGRRERIDASPAGLLWLHAGGDLAVYTREDSTSTVRSWNPATGERRSIETSPSPLTPIVTDGTYVTWLSADGEVVVASLAGPAAPPTVIDASAICSPSIDRGVVCWAERDSDTSAIVRTLDARTGTSHSARVEGFSPLGVDISGPLVIVIGETPDYRSHVYVWDTRTGQVTRRYSAYPAYVSVALISGTRVALNTVVSGTGRRSVHVLDLVSGVISDVTPPDLYALLWSFDGSVAGMAVKRPTSTLEAAWCDLDEQPQAAPDENASAPVTPPRPRWTTSVTVAEESAEPTASETATSTVDATPTAGTSVDEPADPPAADEAETAEPDQDTGLGLGWLIGAVAGLGVLGGAGYALTRRTRAKAS